MNFDGLLGFIIAEEKYLLDPKKWMIEKNFVNNSLDNLGIYQNWTIADVIKDKHASYKGVPSDHCLMEILAKDCYISPFCREMMLAPRVDKGYLLTHRLLYLQIVRLKQCPFNNHKFQDLTRKFCSLILRETRTNQHLGFPAHDIALEQSKSELKLRCHSKRLILVVLCGLEGYAEFLNENWKDEILSWQTPFGCYKSEDQSDFKRSSNVISFGCTDHATGLGAAALALNLRFEISRPDNRNS
ncbi:uncharacterized protein BDFB_005972 [Asbolus verrucosus]|uniref:Uncharacterized protein n=1 Tax=Asbolus verrucosus TaxID=1661398 RepID=A0A482VZG3_ASBVE|nr:uncharacterized protein BDFB_005972 [Asbolus verrucosus]